MFFFSFVSCNEKEEKSRKEYQNLLVLIAILPGLLLNAENGNCPPTSEIPLLEPGTHTVTLQPGEKYWFDITSRKPAQYDGYIHSAWYIVQVTEAVGQDVKLVSENCRGNTNSSSSLMDSGTTGAMENLYMIYHNQDRITYTYFKITEGSNSITFKIPDGEAVPQL